MKPRATRRVMIETIVRIAESQGMTVGPAELKAVGELADKLTAMSPAQILTAVHAVATQHGIDIADIVRIGGDGMDAIDPSLRGRIEQAADIDSNPFR